MSSSAAERATRVRECSRRLVDARMEYVRTVEKAEPQTAQKLAWLDLEDARTALADAMMGVGL